jgi:hypothetical protein
MAEYKVTRCDVCEGEPAVRYIVRAKEAKPWTVDLCSECEQPLLKLRERARSADGRRPYRKIKKVGVIQDPTVS